MGDADWTLLDPWFLLFAVAAWGLWVWRGGRPRAALPAASMLLLDGLPRSLRVRLYWLPGVCVVLGVTALSVALARPVSRDVLPLRERGVDILLLLDVSSSMNVPDMEQGAEVRRMVAAREQALAFARGRVHDRIGLMSYARYPELRCPLTLDERALAAFLQPLDTVSARSPEDGTAIGVALAQAVRFLADSEAESKVVVLLTDGENNVEDVKPAEAAKFAADAGVRVHTIGLGRGRYLPDPFGGPGQMLPADFSEIEQVAEVAGGRFFRALDKDSLARVYAEIDRMERVEMEDPRYRTSEEFGWPLGIGAALLGLALLLELLWIRGAP